MAKINRLDGNVEAFGSSAVGVERTVFGDETTQSDTLDENVTADFKRGWGILAAGAKPPKQFFTGLAFTIMQFVAYLHQIGVPEWNNNQEYHTGSFANVGGILYVSQTDTNTGNDPSADNINWKRENDESIYNTVADMKLATIPAGQLVETKGYYEAGDEGGGRYLIKDTAIVDEEIDFSLAGGTFAVLQYGIASINAGSFTNKTVTVGSGGGYATINDALAYLSKYAPVYKAAGVTATINLLTGFVMAEQVLVRGLDLGWITITGVDAETTITHTALTTDFSSADYGFEAYPAFGVSRSGVLPRIGQMFRFSTAGVGGNKHGIMAVGAGSNTDVLSGCGVADAGTHGIYAYRGSTINAEAADASGAGTSMLKLLMLAELIRMGYMPTVVPQSMLKLLMLAELVRMGYMRIYAYRGSTINAEAADASGAGTYGILASHGSTINAIAAAGTLSQTKNTVTSGGIIFQ
ncbi:MAG: hypothetical protein B6244_14945 [Candidatus Cloacimonetes bacterium 4572_55]|nr:MAG: hypothetical protein B6244_14945 [Candidatus Cloacimonetes bacterium 4572_55]